MPDLGRLFGATTAWLRPERTPQDGPTDPTNPLSNGGAPSGPRVGASRRLDSALRRWSAQGNASDEPAASTLSPASSASSDEASSFAACGPKREPGRGRIEVEDESRARRSDRPLTTAAREPGHSGGDETRFEAGAPAEPPETPEASKPEHSADYYELLQISRNADMETIHRVYRIMATRFHPDNPRTGDSERFLVLTRAYHYLSDPARRAEYDAALLSHDVDPIPLFQRKDFVDGIDGEINRRLGVLSLLYYRRRTNPAQPGISVLDLERRMDFPREYLNFTLWYLRSKLYVSREDNSDYGITAEGIDYIEENSSTNKIIRELLTEGSNAGTQDSNPGPVEVRYGTEPQGDAGQADGARCAA